MYSILILYSLLATRLGKSCAELDEGDEMNVGHHHIVFPGKGCSKQALSNSKFIELTVSAGDATATDPDEIDEPIAHPPTMNSSEFQSMMKVLTYYC